MNVTLTCQVPLELAQGIQKFAVKNQISISGAMRALMEMTLPPARGLSEFEKSESKRVVKSARRPRTLLKERLEEARSRR